MTRYLSILFAVLLSALLSTTPSFATTSSWGSKSACTGFSGTGLLAHNNPVNMVELSGNAITLVEKLAVAGVMGITGGALLSAPGATLWELRKQSVGRRLWQQGGCAPLPNRPVYGNG